MESILNQDSGLKPNDLCLWEIVRKCGSRGRGAKMYSENNSALPEPVL